MISDLKEVFIRVLVTFTPAFLGILYLGSFHFVVVCSGGGISRDSNLVNSMVCLGSRTWDIRFCWRSSRRSSMSQGPTAGAAAAQYLE